MASAARQSFVREARELNELAKGVEGSFRNFCVRLAQVQQQVIAAGIVFKWWARDNLVNPRTGEAWPDGTLKGYVSLGQKSDSAWQEARARKSHGRSLSGLSRRPANEQVEALLAIWEVVSLEARRLFLAQIGGGRGRRSLSAAGVAGDVAGGSGGSAAVAR